jgi:RNA-binding protein YhbY
MILKGSSDELNRNLEATELSKLTVIGKTRSDYEELVNGIDAGIAR